MIELTTEQWNTVKGALLRDTDVRAVIEEIDQHNGVKTPACSYLERCVHKDDVYGCSLECECVYKQFMSQEEYAALKRNRSVTY
jgi:hypothetical protein